MKARREGLKDIRMLLKDKEAEYKASATRLAGFVIQQVDLVRIFVKSLKLVKMYHLYSRLILFST